MNLGGIIAGAIAGIIGAVVWAAIAFYGDLEIGWIAWGIGAAIGFAMSAVSKSGGPGAAAFAVLITVASLVGGKYLAVQMAVSKVGEELGLPTDVSDEQLIEQLAYTIAEAKTLAGEKLAWRNNSNFQNIQSIEDFPLDVLQEATKNFNAMTAEEILVKKDDLRKEIKKAIGLFKKDLANKVFMASFGILDIVFFLLGIVTAGRIAYADYIE